MQTIKVTIKPDATMEYEVSGIKGKSCADVTKFINTISSKVISEKKTGEYFMPAPVQNKLEH